MEELIVDPFRAARLVLRLRQEGVTDDGVLRAMETVDRGAFVDDPELKKLAFADCVLPIPCGQTIPRPAATGQLLQALGLGRQRDARILLIGVGSGYIAALASQLAADVFGVERYNRLTDHARQRIVRLGLDNLAVRHGDGLLGWAERGPYDRVLLTGLVDEVPQALFDQLASDGLVIAPMRQYGRQMIARIAKDGVTEWLGLAHELPPLVAGRSLAL
jgi:protein-L-isoaspartate(D-aspartate) O-methyltransferase